MVRNTESEGNRVGTLRSAAAKIACGRRRPHPERKRAPTSPADSAGEVLYHTGSLSPSGSAGTSNAFVIPDRNAK